MHEPSELDPVGFLPEGYDPDTYIREYGPEALCALIGIPYAPAPLRPRPTRLRLRARIQRREVERLTPEEQDRRMSAILDNLDRLAEVRFQRAHEAALILAAEWEREEQAAAAKRAALQLEQIQAARAAAPATSQGIDPVARARRYVAPIDGAAKGQDRSGAAFGVAVHLMRGFALSERDGLEILAEWNGRCAPPLPERELLFIVRRATNASAGPYGWHLSR